MDCICRWGRGSGGHEGGDGTDDRDDVESQSELCHPPGR